MRGGRYRYDIERFAVFEGELALDGWIVSDAPIDRVRLLSPSAAFDVAVDPQADDADRRLLLSLRLPADAAGEVVAFEDATIEIAATNGDRLAFGIGHQFRPPGWLPLVIELDPLAGLPILVPDAASLADAIGERFGRTRDHDDLFLHRSGGEWIATSHRYGLQFPLPLEPDLDRGRAAEHAPAVIERVAAHFDRLLDDGAPLLVHRGTGLDDEDTMASLYAAMRARNPDAALLWTDPHRQPGAIVRHRPGAIDPPVAGLLVTGPGETWETLLPRVRDLLLSPAR